MTLQSLSGAARAWVLSCHFKSTFWLRTQRKYLDLFIDVPHRRLFAIHGLDDCEVGPMETHIPYDGQHGEGLNRLAEAALKLAEDDDWLIFLDSDAFPIVPVSSILRPEEPFIAVQRKENLGDPQPHPSFCAVKASTWKRLSPDWRRGCKWTNWAGNSVTDVGAGVLEALERNDFP